MRSDPDSDPESCGIIEPFELFESLEPLEPLEPFEPLDIGGRVRPQSPVVVFVLVLAICLIAIRGK
jgi:hypothetical protein